MEGLEKILSRILNDAKEKVDEILSKANAEASVITSDMQRKVDSKCEEILSQVSHDKKNIEERTEASKEHKLTQMKLTTKREAIDATIRLAKESIDSLSDKDYVDLLMKVFDKYLTNSKVPEAVKICFGEKDIKRLSKDTMDLFVKKASEKGIKMTVSDKAVNIKNGFILDFGDILENCSFDTMIDQNKDTLEDTVKKILF